MPTYFNKGQNKSKLPLIVNKDETKKAISGTHFKFLIPLDFFGFKINAMISLEVKIISLYLNQIPSLKLFTVPRNEELNWG